MASEGSLASLPKVSPKARRRSAKGPSGDLRSMTPIGSWHPRLAFGRLCPLWAPKVPHKLPPRAYQGSFQEPPKAPEPTPRAHRGKPMVLTDPQAPPPRASQGSSEEPPRAPEPTPTADSGQPTVLTDPKYTTHCPTTLPFAFCFIDSYQSFAGDIHLRFCTSTALPSFACLWLF